MPRMEQPEVRAFARWNTRARRLRVWGGLADAAGVLGLL